MRDVPGVYDVSRAQHARGHRGLSRDRTRRVPRAARRRRRRHTRAGSREGMPSPLTRDRWPARRSQPPRPRPRVTLPTQAPGPAALLASAVSVCLVAASAPAGPARRRRPPLPAPGQPRLRRHGVRPLLHLPGQQQQATEGRHHHRRPDDRPPGPASTSTSPTARSSPSRSTASPPTSPRPARTSSSHPRTPLAEGSWTRITVRHTSDPVSAEDQDGGWVRTADGLAMANQADVAHLVFPCNDHPSDKAIFTFRVTAPDGYTAVANGLPAGVERAGRRRPPGPTGPSTPWPLSWPRCPSAAPPSLHRTGPHGLPVRDVVPTGRPRGAGTVAAEDAGPDRLDGEARSGRYPFETYGVLMADASTGFELETQTLSLFERDTVHRARLPQVVHRVDHGPRAGPPVVRQQRQPRAPGPTCGSTRDTPPGTRPCTREETGGPAPGGAHEGRLRRLRRLARRREDRPPRPSRPPPAARSASSAPTSTTGRALVLYALRQEIGAAAFERLETRLGPAHRDASVSTADFVRLASAIAGRDLTASSRTGCTARRPRPCPATPTGSRSAAAPAPSDSARRKS